MSTKSKSRSTPSSSSTSTSSTSSPRLTTRPHQASARVHCLSLSPPILFPVPTGRPSSLVPRRLHQTSSDEHHADLSGVTGIPAHRTVRIARPHVPVHIHAHVQRECANANAVKFGQPQPGMIVALARLPHAPCTAAFSSITLTALEPPRQHNEPERRTVSGKRRALKARDKRIL